jgi:hypothetical protein
MQLTTKIPALERHADADCVENENNIVKIRYNSNNNLLIRRSRRKLSEHHKLIAEQTYEL